MPNDVPNCRQMGPTEIAYLAGHRDGFEEGAAVERAAITAYLRDDKVTHAGTIRGTLRVAAAEIERGEHIEDPCQ